MANNTKQQDRLLGREPNPPLDRKLKEKFDAFEKRRNRAALERKRAARTGPPNNVGVEYALKMVTKGSADPYHVNTSAADQSDPVERSWINRK